MIAFRYKAVVFCALLLACFQVQAQPGPPFPPSAEVLPQPVVAGESLIVRVQTSVQSCLNEIVESELTLSGTTLVIDFNVSSTLNVCVTPPLLTFDLAVDGLNAGEYELTLNGIYNGVAVDPVVIPFGVQPPAVSVPAGRWIVPGLGLILLLVGWRRLSGGRMRNY